MILNLNKKILYKRLANSKLIALSESSFKVKTFSIFKLYFQVPWFMSYNFWRDDNLLSVTSGNDPKIRLSIDWIFYVIRQCNLCSFWTVTKLPNGINVFQVVIRQDTHLRGKQKPILKYL